jgi:hypothetical protein
VDSLPAPGKRRNLPQGTQRKGLKDNLQKSSPLFSSYLLSMALSRLGRSSGNRTNARFCNLVAARAERGKNDGELEDFAFTATLISS